MSLKLGEIDSTILEHCDGVICFLVLREIKLKVELPSGDWLWRVALLISQSDSNLNDLHYVHISLNAQVFSLLLLV